MSFCGKNEEQTKTPSAFAAQSQLPRGGSPWHDGKVSGFARGPIPEGAVCAADWGSSLPKVSAFPLFPPLKVKNPGDEKHLAQCRKYSYSDRARYYIGQPEVVAAMNKLFDNLREYPIPMNMLHQYMPISYAKIREGKLKLDPRELAMDGIVQFMLDYESAV